MIDRPILWRTIDLFYFISVINNCEGLFIACMQNCACVLGTLHARNWFSTTEMYILQLSEYIMAGV